MYIQTPLCMYNVTGVTVLLVAPDAEDVNTTIVGAEEFDRPVFPPKSKLSKDSSSIGGTWTVSEDPAVRRYGKYG
jgi:hypothetical protein